MRTVSLALAIAVVAAVVVYGVTSIEVMPDGTVRIGGPNPGEEADLKVYGEISDRGGLVPPVGTVVAYTAATPPDGWLLCDGDTISWSIGDERYRRLVELLSTEAAGVTTHPFYDAASNSARLPDLRGVFVRGIDNRSLAFDPNNPYNQIEANRDHDGLREAGSFQQDTFQGHRHRTPLHYIGSGPQSWRLMYGGWGSYVYQYTDGIYAQEGNNGPPRVGPQTQPANVALYYIIKY